MGTKGSYIGSFCKANSFQIIPLAVIRVQKELIKNDTYLKGLPKSHEKNNPIIKREKLRVLSLIPERDLIFSPYAPTYIL